MPSIQEYKTALLETVGHQRLDLALAHLAILGQALNASQRQELMVAQDNAERKNLLDQWLGEYVAEPVKNLAVLMSEQADWSALSALAQTVAGETAQPTLRVVSSQPLSEETKNWFTNTAQDTLGSPAVRFEVDEALVGGVKLKLGDREVDQSIRTRLMRFVG